MLIPEFDVFLSYAPEDRERIQPLVKALERGGLQVWWEHHYLKPDESIALLERQLNAQRVQLVVWSKNSAGSGRVQAEARIGSLRGRLLATRLEKIIPPRESVAVAYADLANWSGEEDHPGLKQAFANIWKLIGKGTEAEPIPEPAPSPIPVHSAPTSEGATAVVDAPPIPEVKDREETAWEAVVASKLVKQYEDYLRDFPKGKYKKDAESFLEGNRQTDRKLVWAIGGILGAIILVYIIIVLSSML